MFTSSLGSTILRLISNPETTLERLVEHLTVAHNCEDGYAREQAARLLRMRLPQSRETNPPQHLSLT